MSHLEITLEHQLTLSHSPAFEREYRFGAMAAGGTGRGLRARLTTAGLKDWRFDFAWPDLLFAVEVEGGAWGRGRHTRGKGFADDLRKYASASTMGWLIYRCDGEMIRSGRAVRDISAILAAAVQKEEELQKAKGRAA